MAYILEIGTHVGCVGTHIIDWNTSNISAHILQIGTDIILYYLNKSELKNVLLW